MVHIRGHKKDYDRWEEEMGAKGWNYNDVLPFFLKSEDMKDPELAKSRTYPEFQINFFLLFPIVVITFSMPFNR